MYKLRDWVDESRLTHTLSFNTRAVEYLEEHEYLIYNKYIFENENAIHIIEKRVDRLRLMNDQLTGNKNAVNFLRNNYDYISYSKLYEHAHNIEFINAIINKMKYNMIYWRELSKNPGAMHILNNPKYYYQIDWNNLIDNENAIELIRNNLDKVEKYWSKISSKPHLISLIEENMDKVDFDGLCSNYKAIHILEKNVHKIHDYFGLRHNKHGYTLLIQFEPILDTEYNEYDKQIIYDYFDDCKKRNVEFDAYFYLSYVACTEEHFEFLRQNKHRIYYNMLSRNENIFVYDYDRMKKTRRLLPWYNDICKV
jgi:hypothetical protein